VYWDLNIRHFHEKLRDEHEAVAIGERCWQLDKTRFRHTLAGVTVTINEHLDGKVSIRWGLTWQDASPPMAARWRRATKRQSAVEKAGAWKPAKTSGRFSPAPTLPWKSRKLREIPTFPPRRVLSVSQNQEPRRRLTPPKSNRTSHV
jgi:hypothetical protein